MVRPLGGAGRCGATIPAGRAAATAASNRRRRRTADGGAVTAVLPAFGSRTGRGRSAPPIWCGRRDLNPHAFRRQNLNLVRLPVPPRPRGWLRAPRDARPVPRSEAAKSRSRSPPAEPSRPRERKTRACGGPAPSAYAAASSARRGSAVAQYSSSVLNSRAAPGISPAAAPPVASIETLRPSWFVGRRSGESIAEARSGAAHEEDRSHHQAVQAR